MVRASQIRTKSLGRRVRHFGARNRIFCYRIRWPEGPPSAWAPPPLAGCALARAARVTRPPACARGVPGLASHSALAPPPPCGRTLPGALCGLVACPAPLGARTSRVRPPEVPCACGTCRCPCVSNQAGRARRARARARATARARARVRVRVRARARGTAGLGSGRGRGLGRWVRARVRVPLDSEGRTGTFKIRVARGQNRDLGQPKGSERDGDAVPARFY